MAEPVTIAEAKQHLNLDTSNFDTYITNLLIPASRRYCENFLNRSIVAGSTVLTLDAFPLGPITLPNGPVGSVTTVSYVDTDGATQTFTDFTLTGDQISPDFGYEWPATRAQLGAVTITYSAGYSTLEPDIKFAILIVLADLFEYRTVTMDVQRYENPAAMNLLQPYRIAMGV